MWAMVVVVVGSFFASGNQPLHCTHYLKLVQSLERRVTWELFINNFIIVQSIEVAGKYYESS